MSKESNQGAPVQAKANKKEEKNNNSGNNVVAFAINKCAEQDCKSKPQKADFCSTHYDWFKFGLITKTGEKAKDFDKKFIDYERFTAAKAS